jgi:hypothetical protein
MPKPGLVFSHNAKRQNAEAGHQIHIGLKLMSPEGAQRIQSGFDIRVPAITSDHPLTLSPPDGATILNHGFRFGGSNVISSLESLLQRLFYQTCLGRRASWHDDCIKDRTTETRVEHLIKARRKLDPNGDI